MFRFFFHLHHGFKEILDVEGSECPDDAGAIAHGIRIARDMLAEDVRNGHIDLGWKIRIVDDAGALVSSLTFAEVLGGAEIRPRLDLPPRH